MIGIRDGAGLRMRREILLTAIIPESSAVGAFFLPGLPIFLLIKEYLLE
jgi:hypothetical protein